MGQNQELPEEEFSENSEENMRMENDFLKMKMMAESGALFGANGALPADIENQFLKNIMEFEKTQANAKVMKIAEVLGNPVFQDESGMADPQFQIEFRRLQGILDSNSINVDFTKERSDRFIYNFITRELFEHETGFIPVPGMITHFSYEEFHPDHEQEIREITTNFFTDFFTKSLNVDTDYIEDEIKEPDGNLLPREELINRFQTLFELVSQFEDTSFTIDKIEFEFSVPGNENSGMGFSEGMVNYNIRFRDGELKEIKGPFKIYFSRNWDSWNIFFFYLIGYNLRPADDQERG